MKKYKVSRDLLVDVIELSHGFKGVYSKWDGEDNFNFSIQKSFSVPESLQSPYDFRSTKKLHQIRKNIKLPKSTSFNISDYASVPVIFQMKSENLKYRNIWQPVKFMQVPPKNYKIFWYCSFDDFILNIDETPIPQYFEYFVSESSYDMKKLIPFIKESKRIEITSNPYYYNKSLSIGFRVRLTDDEYIEWKTNPTGQSRFTEKLYDSLGISKFKR